MDINHCCCFTGHRPEKLHIPESVVLQELNIAITAALQDGHTTFISGMAKGVDIWAAELILERRRASPEINLICAIPYEGFGLHWKDEWTERLQGSSMQPILLNMFQKSSHVPLFSVAINGW